MMSKLAVLRAVGWRGLAGFALGVTVTGLAVDWRADVAMAKAARAHSEALGAVRAQLIDAEADLATTRGQLSSFVSQAQQLAQREADARLKAQEIAQDAARQDTYWRQQYHEQLEENLRQAVAFEEKLKVIRDEDECFRRPMPQSAVDALAGMYEARVAPLDAADRGDGPDADGGPVLHDPPRLRLRTPAAGAEGVDDGAQ